MQRGGVKYQNSQARIQKRVAESDFLDMLGEDEQSFKPVSLDAVSQTLFDVALEYIEVARQNLIAADKISSGGLGDSMVPTNVVINGKVFTIGIEIASFYKFVDKGVKGWQSGGGSSPYQFKKPEPGKKHGPKASKFVASIRKWLIREGLKQRSSSVNKAVSSRESKRMNSKSFTDTSTRTAIVIAANIRRHGLEPTGFWKDTETEMIKRIKERFKLALIVDIKDNLKWQ